ncbi:MAG: BLUF domain-containing protein [Pseudomonadota bacterium]|nr:BLUF domain-containing protein [Pseudomonadota bacterium]
MRTKPKIELKNLIYVSKPSGFDDKIVDEILRKSRENNIASGITGALICRSDLYFQFLEGPVDSVEKTFGKIKDDKRHTEIQKLKDDITFRRLFASWAMRFDPVEKWIWSRNEIEQGLLKTISAGDAFEVFEKLSREVDQFN